MNERNKSIHIIPMIFSVMVDGVVSLIPNRVYIYDSWIRISKVLLVIDLFLICA